ncbi:MAG: hypothetical protein JWO81_1628 [Alphaproteobacteria bacterium]|nr:hypothetical protein [Alphaproteobacteria bacterium]
MIHDGGRRLNEADLTAAEARLCRQIPSAYRRFLLGQNGGRPSVSDFEFGPDREPANVKSFVGLDLKEESFTLPYVFAMFGCRLPKDFFPIARDAGGNLIGIIDRGERCGLIVYWDHEDAGDDSDKLPEIARDFDEFLKSLNEMG